MTAERHDDSVPVIDFNVNEIAPLGAHWEEIDRLQEEHPWFWTTYAQGHWVLTRMEDIRRASTDTETFSASASVAAEPNPSYQWIPANLDPPELAKYRNVLNPWFSHAAVDSLEPFMVETTTRLVDELAPRGSCEFMHDFAAVYPTTVFLHSLGLPIDDAAQFRTWVRTIFDNLRRPERREDLLEAMGGVKAYFSDVLERRRSAPLDLSSDFISYLIESEVDGRPLTDREILDMTNILMIAGLHTTESQLGFMFHYLAQHPDHRRRLIEDPEVIPSAVEEFLRVHTFVLPGRKLVKDVDFEGCPMKQGDMVMFALPAANRSDETWTDSKVVDFDRHPNRHIAFGYGPHRCIGNTLARRELATALSVWHRAIPDYHLDGDEQLTERGGQLSPISLPLAWG